MKIHEDRSHMNIDTRWFEKGYAKEDVHSLRLQSLCTEAEAAANKQFYDSHTREEWEQYIRQASLESSAAMKPVMEAIAQDFVCYQYDENIPVSYGSDRWDLYFWCNPFNGAANASERDFSYFTLTFNERQMLEKRRKVCQQVLDLLCSRFQEHPNLDVAYSIPYGLTIQRSTMRWSAQSPVCMACAVFRTKKKESCSCRTVPCSSSQNTQRNIPAR